MSSNSNLIDQFKLHVQFHADYTLHNFHTSDRARGQRKVTVQKKWRRKKKLGQGGFGSVWLEEEQDGSLRAVKEIPQQDPSQSDIDYKRELLAMAKFSRVSNYRNMHFQ